MLASVVFAALDRANRFFCFHADFNGFVGLRRRTVASIWSAGDSRRINANVVFVRTCSILTVLCGEHETFCFARFELRNRICPGIVFNCTRVCLDERHFCRRIVGNNDVFQCDFASVCDGNLIGKFLTDSDRGVFLLIDCFCNCNVRLVGCRSRRDRFFRHGNLRRA